MKGYLKNEQATAEAFDQASFPLPLRAPLVFYLGAVVGGRRKGGRGGLPNLAVLL